MPAYPFRFNRTKWCSRDGENHGSFHPEGKPCIYGTKTNPFNWGGLKDPADTDSARLFVGLSVLVRGKQVDRYSMEDLIAFVRGVRKSQPTGTSPKKKVKIPEDSSFVYQKGVYEHKRKGHPNIIVQENAAQIIFIRLKESQAQFEANMLDLAEKICSDMHQDEVIVEIQHNGLVTHVGGVVAK
jgi:hypothetical protein